jgi:hypothetical protein
VKRLFADKSESLKKGRTGQNPVPTVFAEFPHLVRMAKLREENKPRA